MSAVTVSACGNDMETTSGPLRIGDGDFTTSVAYEGESVYSFADVNMCLERAGVAELIALTALESEGGAKVSDFDVVTVEPTAYASYPRQLSDVTGWESEGRRIDEECADGAGPALAIEISKASPQAAIVEFELTYRFDETDYVTQVEFPVAVCDRLENCDPPSP